MKGFKNGFGAAFGVILGLAAGIITLGLGAAAYEEWCDRRRDA